MTSSRLVKILLVIAGLLAFVILAIVLIQHPNHSLAPFAQSVDIAEKITVQTGSAQIELLRDSATWVVSSSSSTGPYKADSEKVKNLQTGLRGIQVEDAISERPDQAASFEINPESATAITLWKSNARLATGMFGKQAPDFAHLYFQYPDKPTVYLARGAIRGDLGTPNLNAWRDRSLLNIAEDQVLTLLIQGPGFTTALARSSDTWSLNGRIVDPTPVWGMLGLLAHLRAESFADGSEDPRLAAGALKYASVTLQMRDNTVHVLHIGQVDPQTKRYPVSIDADSSVA